MRNAANSLLDLAIRNQAWAIYIVVAVVLVLAPMLLYRPADELQGIVRWSLPEMLVIPFLLLGFLLPSYWLGYLGFLPKTVHLDLAPLLRSNPESKYLLVFIHGWRGDAVNTWGRFPELLVQDARFATFDIASIDYPTFMVRRSLGLPALVAWLLDRMRRDQLFARYQAIAIVAHSVGGLVARELYVQATLANDIAPIRVIVAIGTPHQGADVAKLASVLGIGSKLLRDVAPGSTFLSTLKIHWNALADRDRPETHGISSPQDDVVPQNSAHFLCDKMFSYPQWGHKDLVKPETPEDDRYSKPVAIVLGTTAKTDDAA